MNTYLYKSINFSIDPIHVFDLFADESYLFFLDSSSHHSCNGRYSIIGFDPFDTFECQGKATLDKLKEKFLSYQKILGPITSARSQLTSGIVGYLSYDYGLSQENIKTVAKDDFKMPDCFFGFYDCILTIDHVTQTLTISSSGLPESNARLRQKRAKSRINTITQKLSQLPDNPKNSSQADVCINTDEPDLHTLPLTCNLSKEQYFSAVNKALNYIANGDIYQVNLSQRFEYAPKKPDISPTAVYKSLRNLSPCTYGAYFDGGNFQILSNSPEQFLQLNDRLVHTQPMKGTRPRAHNEQKDKELKQELLQSAKDKAELLMITDLLRNDLGKVCDYRSIHVKKMRTLEKYPYVFQMTSTIEGTLQETKDAFDLLKACFPGGSITGCPKIRAMEIIEELEPTRRGPYTGSLGYIDFSGNMDFNILIRSLLSINNKYYFQTGGGIVSDSTPEEEYQETLVKTRALRTCLQQSF